ncbi:MAG: hypothetical protein ACTSPL_08195 [Candidatus Odinarchaeia archaeon]
MYKIEISLPACTLREASRLEDKYQSYCERGFLETQLSIICSVGPLFASPHCNKAAEKLR